MSQYNPERDTLLRFDSPEEYLMWHKETPREYINWSHRNWREYEDFCGCLSFHQALHKLENGDLTCANAAKKIIDQMSDQEVFNSGHIVTQPDIVGFMPLVPAVIAGLPYNMLTRKASHIESTLTPISIYYATSVSGAVSTQQIMNRGVAAIALTMALSVIRPVELYAVYGNDISSARKANGLCIKIASKPFDLSRAAWILTSPAFPRRLGFTATARMNNFIGNTSVPWAWDLHPRNDGYSAAWRDMLGCEDTDIFITGGHINDTLMQDNPVAWVKLMIEECKRKFE